MKKQNLRKFSLSFFFLLVSLAVAAYLILQFVWYLNRDKPYLATLCVNSGFVGYCFSKFDEHPLPYLLSIVLVSSLFGALWLVFWVSRYREGLIFQILSVPWISVVVVSPIYGLIYSMQLRSPAYFDGSSLMWFYYRTDALDGLRWGWLSALQSFPINILSYTAFCVLLYFSYKRFSVEINVQTENT